MFIEENCTLCGECFTGCHWVDADYDTAIRWIEEITEGENSEVLKRCVTCYSCNERCPTGANPFDRIAELQDKYQTLLPPEELIIMENKFKFSGEIKDTPKADRIMSICVFGGTHSELIQGQLFDIPTIGGKPYFCWLMLEHVGSESIKRKHTREFVNRLADTGASEIICFHDDCYTMLASEAPKYDIELPFTPIHISQYLVEVLKDKKDQIRPLNLDIAYQRPCASRLTPEKEPFIDELFELVGVRRVDRTYDRENGICCGGTTHVYGKNDPRPYQEKNIDDALRSGAKAIICLCPMCKQMLEPVAKENHLPIIFLSDLARAALGEIEI